MRKLKKGFTLVELLVVIAILAILATVSVVGYFSFTEKANVSNDTSMTTQMNTILEAEEAAEGKNTTAYDAFTDLEENGVTIDNLKPYSDGYKYAWDKATDRMVLLDDNKNIVVGDAESYDSVNLFIPVDSASEISTANSAKVSSTKLSAVKLDSGVSSSSFSIYLTAKYSDTSLEITANISVDLGKNTNVTTVTYGASVSNDVYVRTNGGDLTVSSVSGDKTLSILGTSSTTTISGSAKVSVESEIENNLEIKGGSITVEANASIATIVVSSESASVKIESNSEVNSIVANSSTNITQSGSNQVVVLSESEVETVKASVCDKVSDFSKIYSKVPYVNGDDNIYDETGYLEKLDSANVTDISLYFDTEYVVSGSVNSVEIDGTTYGKDDKEKHSVGNSVFVELNAFKIDETSNHLLVDKLLYFSALINDKTLKVNGQRVSLKWDAYTASGQTLKASNFKFKSTATNYSYNISDDGTIVLTYTGTIDWNMFEFKYDDAESGDIILWKKEKSSGITYSLDKVESDGFVGMYPIKPTSGCYTAQYDYSYTETKTLYIFSSDGTFKGVILPIDFEYYYYVG